MRQKTQDPICQMNLIIVNEIKIVGKFGSQKYSIGDRIKHDASLIFEKDTPCPGGY